MPGQYPSVGPLAFTQVVAPITLTDPFDFTTLATLNITLDVARRLLLWSYVTPGTFFDSAGNAVNTRITVDGVQVTLTGGLTAQEQVTQSAHALSDVLAPGAHAILLQVRVQVDETGIGFPFGSGALSALICG